LKCGVFTFIGFIVQEHCENKPVGTDSFSSRIFETAIQDSLNSSWSFAITVVSQYLGNQRLALFLL
jgi:hypothetical protein